MIKHIVMWRLKDVAAGATKEENALKLKESLESLVPRISSRNIDRLAGCPRYVREWLK